MVYGEKRKSRALKAFLLLMMFCTICFCTIYAGAAGKSTSAAPAKKYTLSKTTAFVTKSRTIQLKLFYAKKIPVTKSVVWKSSNTSIAKVSQTGKVYGIEPGKCKITAKYKGKTYNCCVTVYSTSRSYLPKQLKQTYAASKYKGRILLAGSSSIEFWDSAASAFAPDKILNVGVSGSTVTDWQKWYTTLITRYKPKAVVLYVGSNDIGNGLEGKSGAQTASATKKLLQAIKKKLPGVPVFYISICPSIKRCDAWDEIAICNAKMKRYCASKKNLYYIDTASYCWSGDSPNPALYLSDHLHFNAKGYKIWNNVIPRYVRARIKKS